MCQIYFVFLLKIINEMKSFYRNKWLSDLSGCLYVADALDRNDIVNELKILELKYFTTTLDTEDWDKLYEIEKSLTKQ